MPFIIGLSISSAIILFMLVAGDSGDSWETYSEIMTKDDGTRELIGTIQNRSKQIVKYVHVTIHFLDKDDQVVDVKFVEVARIPAGKSAGIRIDIDDETITHHRMGLSEGHGDD